MRHVLNPTKVQQIRDLYRAGFSRNSIAATYGTGNGTIQDLLEGRTWKDVPDNPGPLPAIASASITPLRQRTLGNKRKLTPQLVRTIRGLRSRGSTQRDIAKVIGVSQPTVCYVLTGQIHRDVVGAA
jgi:DNA-binding transcriptional regulator YiaG